LKRLEQIKAPESVQKAASRPEGPILADDSESRSIALQRETDETIYQNGLDPSIFADFRTKPARLDQEETAPVDKEMSRIFASVGSIVSSRVFGVREARVQEIVDETREAIMMQTANSIGAFIREEYVSRG
jgi:hypothetical protein